MRSLSTLSIFPSDDIVPGKQRNVLHAGKGLWPWHIWSTVLEAGGGSGVDACAASHTKVPFVQYLPGIVATLALIMINAIRRYIPTFHLLANHVWVTFQKPGHHALPACLGIAQPLL